MPIKAANADLFEEKSISVVVKRDSWCKDVLLCQNPDQAVNFSGDSGAVGRMTVKGGSLFMDLKGRQYKGEIMSGPLVMVLNLTAPVATKATKKRKATDQDEPEDKDDKNEDRDKVMRRIRLAMMWVDKSHV